MVGFVDETSGSTNDFDSQDLQSPEYYLNLAQKDAQLCNDLLNVTGGRLGLEKCSHHILYFDFTLTDTPFLSPMIPSDALQVLYSHTNNFTSIKAL
jgi:hypothetical protein